MNKGYGRFLPEMVGMWYILVQEKKNVHPCRYICMLAFIWKQVLCNMRHFPLHCGFQETTNSTVRYSNHLLSDSWWWLVCSFSRFIPDVSFCIVLCLKTKVCLGNGEQSRLQELLDVIIEISRSISVFYLFKISVRPLK